MSTNLLQGKWSQLQGEIKEQWGKLTDDDLKKIKGQRDKLEGALQEKYGYTKVKAREEVEHYLDEVGHRYDETRGKVQDTLHEAQERFTESKEKAAHMAKEKADQYNQRLEEAVTGMPGNPAQLVSEYPWLVIITVMVVGITVGFLLRQRS